MSESNPLKAMIGRIDLLDRRVESLEVEEHAVSTARTTTTGGGTYVIEVLDFAINNVLLLKDGEPYPGVYPPTDAGLAAANAAATADDVVLVPVATFTGDYTVGTSVEWRGRGVGFSVLTGEITLSDGSLMDGLGIVRTADQAGDLVAIVPPASGMAYVEHCNIMAENANGAGYAAYGACDHLTLRWCYIAAESGGTDANPFGSYEETLSDAYFDCSEGGPTDPEGAWTDPGQAFDGEQVAAICYESEGVEGETYYLHGAGTTASGTGTITKVEARAEGDIVLCSWNCLRLAYTVYTASLAEELGEEPGACRDVPPTGFPEWSEWIELDEPIAGWSWALVQALEVTIWPGNAGSAGTDVTASGVWLRITSEGSAGDPITHACVIPNSDGRAMAMPEYGDRASWRTDHDDGATHADDWDAGDSHHAQSHALASEADHTDVDNEAKADGYVLVWRTAAGKHVYETKGSTIVAGEEDADPVGMYAALKFPNDSLTDNMDGSISVSFRRTGVISYAIDGGGSVITTGCHGFLPVPANCTIIEAQAVASPLGSAVIDIWADSFANFPPTDADTITGTAPITIVSAVGVDNTQFVTWTTSLTAGDWLGFNVDSVSTAVQVIVALYVEYD